MAWTYFTSYLTSEKQITLAQRNELLDAFNERLLVTCDGVGTEATIWTDASAGLASTMADVRTSRVQSDLVDATIVSRSTERMWTKLLTLQGYFRSSVSSTTNVDLRTVVASELGITTAQLDAVVGSPIKSTLRWNILRAGIRQLQYVALRAARATTFPQGKTATSTTSFAAAAAASVAGSEFDTGSAVRLWGGRVRGIYNDEVPNWTAQVERQAHEMTLRDTPAWTNGYDLYGLGNSLYSDLEAGDDFEVDWDGTAGSMSPTAGSSLLASGLTSIGAFDVDFRLTSFDDDTVLSAYDPTPSNTSGRFVEIKFTLVPTFTHP